MGLFSKNVTKVVDRLPGYARAAGQQGLQDLYKNVVLGGSPLLQGAEGLSQRTLAGDFMSPSTNQGFQAYLNALGTQAQPSMNLIAQRARGMTRGAGALQQNMVQRPLQQRQAGLTAQNYGIERARQLQAAMQAPELANYRYSALQNYLNTLQGTRDVVTYKKGGLLSQIAPLMQIAGLVAAPFSLGASLAFTGAGGAMSQA